MCKHFTLNSVHLCIIISVHTTQVHKTNKNETVGLVVNHPGKQKI